MTLMDRKQLKKHNKARKKAGLKPVKKAKNVTLYGAKNEQIN